MKIDKPIMGFVEYKGKNVPFIYQDEKLQLIPPNVETWRTWKSNVFKRLERLKEDIRGEEWIENIYLSGKTNDGEAIKFYIENLPSNNNGFINFYVIYFVKYNIKKIQLNNIYGFSIQGREIDYFYNPIVSYNEEIESSANKIKIRNIKVEKPKKELVGIYKHNNTEVGVELSIIYTYKTNSKIPIEAKSRFEFKFSKPQDLKNTLDIYWNCRLFLCYVSGRKNLKLDDIKVYGDNKKFNNENGVIHICLKDNAEENYEMADKRIINYEYLKEKSILLFQAIEENSMYLENLCSSIDETNSYGIDRIIQNFVAFEREYRNLYKEEITRSQEYNEAKTDVIDCLKELADSNSGKKRGYIKKFAKKIEKIENDFGTRMSDALSDCEEILLPFLKYYYKEYNSAMIEDICDRMNKLRNDSAHGNIDLEIKPIHISDFSILEELLYAMRLKDMNIDIMNIRKAIKSLKAYSIIIDED